jgi:hypothetical protein
MRGLSKAARKEVEAIATCLIESGIRKHGPDLPTNDPDYAEAYGVLRGAIATQGKRITTAIRVEPGNGDPTHGSIHEWYRELLSRIVDPKVAR